MTTPNRRRTRRGWLTKEALAAGLVEQRAWFDSDDQTHTIELRETRDSGKYLVQHTIKDADGLQLIAIDDTIYDRLTDAREAFDKLGRDQ